MSWKLAGTLHLDTVVEDPNVDIIVDRIVAVQKRIGDDLVKGFRWIRNGRQPTAFQQRILSTCWTVAFTASATTV